jgi:hypothetical protein
MVTYGFRWRAGLSHFGQRSETIIDSLRTPSSPSHLSGVSGLVPSRKEQSDV